MALGRRRSREGMNAWPGYVDALSTLLMVIIFVLLVFALAQGFLSVALSSRDQALDRLNRQVAELAELLSLERGQGAELRGSVARLTEELRGAAAARDAALGQLSGLREERDRQGAERDALRTERDRLAARLADLELSAGGAAARIASLEQRLAEAQNRAEAIGGGTAQTLGDLTAARRALEAERTALAETRRQLEQAQARAGGAEAARDQNAAALAAARQQLDALRAEAEALNRTVTADRATIEARLADIARLTQQVQQLTALRDELERRAQAALDRAGEQERARSAAEALAQAEAARRQAAESAATEANTARQGAEAAAREAAEARRTAEAATTAAAEARRRAEAEGGEHARLAESARAQVALLTQQVTQLRAELSRIAALLEAEEQSGRDKEAQISQLGQRLNAALAARVEELQRYRSDFFGRLRDVLGDRPEVRIVGDRFVFQGEVLFPVGGAELSAAGQQQLRALAQVLLEVTRRFPQDLAWILRVDGHADRSPLRAGARYASNWELSAARAIAVGQFLIGEGLPPNRVAATAFGEYQPIDSGDSPEAFARNRRIELRLTDR
ncbi:peptidoglycan -binding protein [Pseudoroseomonas cervicalis]|uniref:peptidoglycan -binding protein n=1 Tax=Teichococcus cervicalis TaxID=204525 RepID=UPI0022F1AE71|nr:peptidoglycan -binding protein [Pseudoroseomonas cervicalis]WBV42003.1 peptidoglycan -binding protein [Pseudoroseomonas cervicalis]